ncbi:acireductone dioxygenase [Pseudomonas sp. AOB-7]|jgi:1,2-dihydroxy-3-keto-5-methylthiopentene dioxygenase|uniref:acireductone dioxygenase n=1 Tax=Pseudomonas sp. AOB-7 TaxID=2482750 RepID=UPI000EFC35D4|nr:acireductone dioxygenase [Pseudomonas sp. AOB-7]RMH86323.1 acireductone dioxygenase [Pseudomonas sp. AOB-7]
MTSLSVHLQTSPQLPNKVLTHAEDIASTLAEVGVRYRQCPPPAALRPGCSEQEFDAACGAWLQDLRGEGGYRQHELLSLERNHPRKLELRARYLDEQTQPAASAWLFVGGFAQLSLHLGEYVYVLQGERGDLLELPADTRHWFDLGEEPHLLLVRLSATAEAPSLTGDQIASRFPRLGD